MNVHDQDLTFVTRREAVLASMRLLESLYLHHADIAPPRENPALKEERVLYSEVVVSRLPTIKMIIDATAEYFRISPVALLSERRTQDIIYPRFLAIWLSKELTLRSLPSIGKTFANRDHSTILNACRRIDAMKKKDERVKDDIDLLKMRIWDRLRMREAA